MLTISQRKALGDVPELVETQTNMLDQIGGMYEAYISGEKKNIERLMRSLEEGTRMIVDAIQVLDNQTSERTRKTIKQIEGSIKGLPGGSQSGHPAEEPYRRELARRRERGRIAETERVRGNE